MVSILSFISIDKFSFCQYNLVFFKKGMNKNDKNHS